MGFFSGLLSLFFASVLVQRVRGYWGCLSFYVHPSLGEEALGVMLRSHLLN